MLLACLKARSIKLRSTACNTKQHYKGGSLLAGYIAMVTCAVNCSRPAGMKSPPTDQFSSENSVTIPRSPLDSAGSVGGSKVFQ